MRLFLAIELPKEVKDYLFELQKKFKEAKVTWVSKKNLHLTLKFMGEVDESKLDEIKSKIRIQAKSISANLGRLGFFPSSQYPKIIWVSVEPEDLIVRLQQRVDGELLTLFPQDQRFKSHVTLGRIKSIRRKEEFFDSINNLEVKPMEFQINSFQLVKSELSRGSPRYEVLQNVDLS